MVSGFDGVDDSEEYVTPPGHADPDAWTTLAGSRGSQRLVEVGEIRPPETVAQALGLGQGDMSVVRRRVMLLDDRPVELTDSYFPSAIARDTPLAERGKIKGGATRALADLGYTAHEVLEDVSVRPATQVEAQQLRLTEDALVLALFRVVLTADHTPYEVSMMTMNPQGRHLRYRITMG